VSDEENQIVFLFSILNTHFSYPEMAEIKINPNYDAFSEISLNLPAIIDISKTLFFRYIKTLDY
ncbi:MAG: hypothetical protein KAJ45_09200, partial [Desulfobulbaceae bacterium]|nr:hypothetical protein [Desulfobulbaceae bacterium]